MNIKKIKELIEGSPLRKSDIIAQSGVSKGTLDNVLKGIDPKVSTIEAIAKVLGVSPAVFWETDAKESQQALGPKAVAGHHISINDSDILKQTLDEIAAHRKVMEKSQEHISDLTKAVLNLTNKYQKQ